MISAQPLFYIKNYSRTSKSQADGVKYKYANVEVPMAKYPKEEKERLIDDFKSSGLSISSRVKKNHLPVSTVTGWMNKHKKKSITSDSVKFIEIKKPLPSRTLKLMICNISIVFDDSTNFIHY